MASESRRSSSEAFTAACAARPSAAWSSDARLSVTSEVAAVRDRFAGRPRAPCSTDAIRDADARAEDADAVAVDAEDADAAAENTDADAEDADADAETWRARGNCVRGKRFDVAPEVHTAAPPARLT